MTSSFDHKNIDDLNKNKDFLTLCIKTLQSQLHKAQLEYKENDINIKKIEVSLLDKNDLIKKIGVLISTRSQDKNILSEKGVDVHRIYSDGTHEYCRNITRGNWMNIHGKLLNVIEPELNCLFPLFFTRLVSGYDEIERYADMTFSDATEVRKVMESLSDVYKYG